MICDFIISSWRLLGDLELRETKFSKGAGLGVRLYVTSRGQMSMEGSHSS